MSHDINGRTLQVPEISAFRRWGTTLVQGAISSAPIPFVSGLLGNAYGELAWRRINERQDKLLHDIVDTLQELQCQHDDLTVEKLATNDAFVATMLRAVDAASRNYQQEKLDALRYAVLNTALSLPSEDELRIPFLNLIDALSPCQMQLLTFFHDPRPYGVESIRHLDHPKGPASEVAKQKIPCLHGQQYLYDFYVNDLANRGLLSVEEGLDLGRGTLARLNAPRTTAIGDAFIMFIRSPLI